MFIWIYFKVVPCKSCFVNATETEIPVISITSPNTEVINHYQVVLVNPFSHIISFLHLANPTENLWGKFHPKRKFGKRILWQGKLPRNQEFLKCFDFRTHTKKGLLLDHQIHCYYSLLVFHRGRKRNIQRELM